MVDHDGNPVAMKDEKGKPMNIPLLRNKVTKRRGLLSKQNARGRRFVKRSISRFCITMRSR
ncbi:MAG: hypothetical protein WDO73_34290 [Ignavibacteriota bacterium]